MAVIRKECRSDFFCGADAANPGVPSIATILRTVLKGVFLFLFFVRVVRHGESLEQ